MSLTQKIGQVITLSTFIFGSFIPTAFCATAPQAKTESKPKTLLAQSTVEARYGNYKLLNCRRTRKEVVCGVLVTNISNKRRRFYFEIDSGGTRATDFSGNLYEISKITSSKYVSRRGSLSVYLSPQIPTKFNFYFPIPQNVNQLVGVELNTGYDGQIIFRNIPIKNNSRVKRKCTCE